MFKFLIILILCVINTQLSNADYWSDLEDDYQEYQCGDPLLHKAVLTATSSLRERGPENARLNGGNAWTARNSDFDQQLVIDLGQVHNITSIDVQGRPFSTEYVTEFSLSYGYNGLDYADYKEPGGNIKADLHGLPLKIHTITSSLLTLEVEKRYEKSQLQVGREHTNVSPNTLYSIRMMVKCGVRTLM